MQNMLLYLALSKSIFQVKIRLKDSHLTILKIQPQKDIKLTHKLNLDSN